MKFFSLFLLSALSLVHVSTCLTLDELNHEVKAITALAQDCIQDYEDLIHGHHQDELVQVKFTQDCAYHLAASYDKLGSTLLGGLADITGNVGDIEANVLSQDASRKLVLTFRDNAQAFGRYGNLIVESLPIVEKYVSPIDYKHEGCLTGTNVGLTAIANALLVISKFPSVAIPAALGAVISVVQSVLVDPTGAKCFVYLV